MYGSKGVEAPYSYQEVESCLDEKGHNLGEETRSLGASGVSLEHRVLLWTMRQVQRCCQGWEAHALGIILERDDQTKMKYLTNAKDASNHRENLHALLGYYFP